MILNFKNDSEVIIYALEKIISFAQQNQYFFVASCVWWIASVIGLDTGLIRYIDNLVRAGNNQGISSTPRKIARDISVDSNTQAAIVPARDDQGISSIPRDIAKDISVDSNTQKAIVPADYISDHLRRTRKGRIDPLPKTKKQFGKARQIKTRIKQQ